MKSNNYLFFLFPCLLLLLYGVACQEITTDPQKVLYESAQLKLEAIKQISYTSTSYWENNFAEHTYRDTVFMSYSKLKNSHFGFGFYYDIGSMEGIYNGREMRNYDHKEETIIRTDSAEIASDSAYFDQQMMMAFSPLELPSWDSISSRLDTMISGNKYLMATKESAAPSVNDSGKIIVSQESYFIDYEDGLIHQLIHRSITGADTIQTITYQFNDFKFEDAEFDFSTIDIHQSLSYREISEVAFYEELEAKVIRTGEQLTGKIYTSIDGNPIKFTERSEGESVIMFSFIGCGGCEYAMKEMQQQEFVLKPGIALYYSSPLDKQGPLTNYLKRKDFPFQAFSKESMMNEEFKVVSFPTFVHIDENGKIINVISGYKDSVADILF